MQAKLLRSLTLPCGDPIAPQRWPQRATPVRSVWEAREGPSRCNRQRSLCLLHPRGVAKNGRFGSWVVEDREGFPLRSTCTPAGGKEYSSAVGPGRGEIRPRCGRGGLSDFRPKVPDPTMLPPGKGGALEPYRCLASIAVHCRVPGPVCTGSSTKA